MHQELTDITKNEFSFSLTVGEAKAFIVSLFSLYSDLD